MNVVYVWDADYPWDVRTEKVCRAMTAAGHTVHIVARNRAWQPLRETRPEGTVHRMAPWRWAGRALDHALGFPAFFNPRWAALIAATIRAERADLVIVRDLPLCPTAIWAARRARIPVILDMAENYPAMIQAVWTARRQRPWDIVVRNPRFVAGVERWCLPRLDHILVVVEESAARLRALGVPGDRITVVSNTPPRERALAAPPDRARPAGAPLELVYLGLLEIPRGVGDVLDAVAGLRAQGGPAVHVRVIGDGRDRALLESHAARLGLGTGTVEFLGHVPNTRALELVAAAQIGLIPHHADDAWNTTVPNKLFDYMAAGLPVITSDAAPAARIVRETGAGVVYRASDSEDLAAAIGALADPTRRAAAAAGARGAVLDRYHFERDAAALNRAVTTLIGG